MAISRTTHQLDCFRLLNYLVILNKHKIKYCIQDHPATGLLLVIGKLSPGLPNVLEINRNVVMIAIMITSYSYV